MQFCHWKHIPATLWSFQTFTKIHTSFTMHT